MLIAIGLKLHLVYLWWLLLNTSLNKLCNFCQYNITSHTMLENQWNQLVWIMHHNASRFLPTTYVREGNYLFCSSVHRMVPIPCCTRTWSRSLLKRTSQEGLARMDLLGRKALVQPPGHRHQKGIVLFGKDVFIVAESGIFYLFPLVSAFH